jgi:hypothetical protein
VTRAADRPDVPGPNPGGRSGVRRRRGRDHEAPRTLGRPGAGLSPPRGPPRAARAPARRPPEGPRPRVRHPHRPRAPRGPRGGRVRRAAHLPVPGPLQQRAGRRLRRHPGPPRSRRQAARRRRATHRPGPAVLQQRDPPHADRARPHPRAVPRADGGPPRPGPAAPGRPAPRDEPPRSAVLLDHPVRLRSRSRLQVRVFPRSREPLPRHARPGRARRGPRAPPAARLAGGWPWRWSASRGAR